MVKIGLARPSAIYTCVRLRQLIRKHESVGLYKADVSRFGSALAVMILRVFPRRFSNARQENFKRCAGATKDISSSPFPLATSRAYHDKY